MIERIDTVIVGGGQAGLAMSHRLTRARREHVIGDWFMPMAAYDPEQTLRA